MLEISGNDINALNDGDLRILVGLLCEAELRSHNLPTAGVTFGGHQDAPDGGLDVRVNLSASLPPGGFIPKSNTGFQVKKPDMPPAKIRDEMTHKGQLRQVIRELADQNGAYIIISSSGSTADVALQNRKQAMREALSSTENAKQLTTDFYDRERIAAWVRGHPSLVLWVRDKIGNSIAGWRPFENWANPAGSNNEEYLLDEKSRLYQETSDSFTEMTPVEGINCLRKILRQSRTSVRLVGLSGVGKTRLLQALFDDGIGELPLNPSQVFYADMGSNPDPDPCQFAERLIARKAPAILVIDNCPPELHRQLTSRCIAHGSLISLITVEYDIQEDQPEETTVFRLEPASVELVERLLPQRNSSLSPTDAKTIAEFSGGNFRIALALTNTISQGGTFVHLRDAELFNRLFAQRNPSQSNLLKSAEVCSLVYSFDGENTDNSSELNRLASIINMTPSNLFSDIAELKRRGLVQQRHIWKAVLPHAIANRLAQLALENIPLSNILQVFESGPERLLKSFSKRLSYLVDNEKALQIAKRWLNPRDGLIDLRTLNDHTVTILTYIAPVIPDLIVPLIKEAMDRNGSSLFCRSNPHLLRLAQILRSIAYYPHLFQPSVNILCHFALSPHPDGYDIQSRDILKSLFHIRFSGTHASPEQRLDFIKGLIDTNDEPFQRLGVELLSAGLDSGPFRLDHHFDFGGHSRDYGYFPKTKGEIQQWFSVFLSYLKALAVSTHSIAPIAKKLLADKFRGLWVIAGMHDQLEETIKEIHKMGAWEEGWLTIDKTLTFDASKIDPSLVSRLKALKELIAPGSIIERAHICLRSGFELLPNFDGSDDKQEKRSDRFKRDEIVARELGKEVAENPEVFSKLLPEMIRASGLRPFPFGEGLAEGCNNYQAMWECFRQELSRIDPGGRLSSVLRGFLSATFRSNSTIAKEILDKAVEDDVLGPIYPWLELSVVVDDQGVERLKKSLDLGKAPIDLYQHVGYGGFHKGMNDENFCSLLKMIKLKQGGLKVAIELFHMRLYETSKNGPLTPNSQMNSLGRELLDQIQFHRSDDSMDYKLSLIVDSCLEGETAKEVARAFANKLVTAIANGNLFPMFYTQLLGSLAHKQPLIFLDCFWGDSSNEGSQVGRKFSFDMEAGCNPLSKIEDDVILDWCIVNPDLRYQRIASVIQTFRTSTGHTHLEWTPLALALIENAPDPIPVLNELKNSLRPMSWAGSRAQIMETRLNLLTTLKDHSNSEVSEWAIREEINFREEIAREFQREHSHNRLQYQRFE